MSRGKVMSDSHVVLTPVRMRASAGRIRPPERATRPSASPALSWAASNARATGARDGRRLDLLASTAHDRLVEEDYRSLMRQGISAARDGVRWHLIETAPGCYDWSSLLPMLRAARRMGLQVVWDLCHYGWPDHLDIWSEAFP